MTEPQVPEGFEPLFRQSPLTDPWEPFYSKRDGERFRIYRPHCNSRGKVLGGLIAALTLSLAR